VASFTTFAQAESRAKVLMDNGKSSTFNIIAAHAGRTKSGVICVRVKRGMTLSPTRVSDGQKQSKAGAWEELIDTAAT
jgi:hypothetical protein